MRTDVAFHYAIASIPQNPIFTSMHNAVAEWLTEQRAISGRTPIAFTAAFTAHERIFDSDRRARSGHGAKRDAAPPRRGREALLAGPQRYRLLKQKKRVGRKEMAEYPGSETERRIAPAELSRVVTTIFRACAMEEADAALLAATLVNADQRGIHSHGTLRVGDYVKKLTTDGVDPRGRPSVASDNGAALVVDAGNAMGQIAADFAMRAAIERAQTTHVAVAAVRNSNHCGAMDYWAAMPLPHDMIGIAMTNALPTMAPWGGIEKIVGINPLAVAFPSANEPPILLDIAFGATAHGKIRVYHQKGHRHSGRLGLRRERRADHRRGRPR